MDLNFLEEQIAPQDAAPVDEPQPVVEEAPQEAAPVSDGPPRAPDGKFAPKEQPAAPQEAPVVQALPVEPVIPAGHVPLAVVLDTRDKLQAANSRAEALERQLAEFQRANQPPPVDFNEDPQGFITQQQAQVQQLVLNSTLNMSEAAARRAHGAETVSAAQQWAVSKGAAYGQEVLSSVDPYEKVVQDFKRDQLVSALDATELEQFKAWKAAQGQVQTPAPIPPQSQVVAPPRSLASAPNAGGAVGHVPTGPGQAYAALFNG